MAFAVGGTAGHVVPALAVASELRECAPDWQVFFVGSGAAFEKRLVPREDFVLHVVPGAPFRRTSAAGKLRALGTLPVGILAARQLLRRLEAEVVVGFGGYATVPTLLAARSLGLRTGIHEANADLGLSNRRLARLVDRVWLGLAPASGIDGRLTGTPVRSGFRARAGRPAEPPSAHEAFRVLVLSGSDPSPFLDERVPPLLARVVRGAGPVTVRHQAAASVESVRAAYAANAIAADVAPFLDDLPEALADAHFVVTRSGGGVLAELGVIGRPALLVPLAEASESHQSRNAAVFSERTGAWRVEEDAWDEARLADLILELRRDPEDWRRRARAVGSANGTGATVTLAREILALASG
jgi:UDP-N-acetylglucosamine--N-acetylmuramyl-(pentapeptide) pyrophosphoryl-undecaprenol N-acetylglucosamine transferase